MKTLLLTLALILLAPRVFACSCGYIQAFDVAARSNPVLVHVKVKEIKRSGPEPHQVEHATVEVIQVLKGQKIDKEITVAWGMCYHSINVSDLVINNEYIFPFNLIQNGKYYLLGCSHSGAELKNEKLFTYEFDKNGLRTQKYFLGFKEFLKEYGL